LQFNKNSWITNKRKVGASENYKTAYSYSEKGQLTTVVTHRAGKLWRTSVYGFKQDELVSIHFTDEKTKERFTLKAGRQNNANGWFDIQAMIETPGLPSYTQYLSDGSLVWSNKGDVNNGLGELYYLRTVDGVTSSSVVKQDTLHMEGRGGYRYQYYDKGQLSSVESYNGHDNSLFHETRYQYDELGLLLVEERKVTGESPFNQAINEKVNYEYILIDGHGNWTKRKLKYSSRFQSQVYIEVREIGYY
jgi:hypothetical protein